MFSRSVLDASTLRPQAAVLRVFAFARVVADQLDVDAVELGDEAPVDRDVGGLRLAGAVARFSAIVDTSTSFTLTFRCDSSGISAGE
jgi:hypothetical protein